MSEQAAVLIIQKNISNGTLDQLELSITNKQKAMQQEGSLNVMGGADNESL
jgi:hypothetical protein